MREIIKHRGTNGEFSLVALHEGRGSSKFSINGTSPENWAGNRICYVSMPYFDLKRDVLCAELWVCATDLSDAHKITDVRAGRHNAVEASWVDDERIAYVSREGPDGHSIFVVDSTNGEVLYGPIFGRICHQARKHLVAFGVTPETALANHLYEEIQKAGIYTLDCDSGEIRLVIPTDKMHAAFQTAGLTLTNHAYSMSHVQINPSATRVMAMWTLAEYRVICSCDMEGGDIRIVHKKPVHQIWFDEESYLATYDDRTDPDRKLGKQQMYRYSLDGEILEYIAGLGNHVDASPDRNWFVTDSLNHSNPVSLYLFQRGHHEPFVQLDSHRFTHLTWETSVHANPTFSRDGTRVYFTRPADPITAKAYFIDISSIVASS